MNLRYLLFLIPVVLVYYTIGRKKQSYVLFAASICYYIFFNKSAVIFVLAIAVLDYFAALLLQKHKSKLLMLLVVIIHALLLFYMRSDMTSDICVPIGISFMTLRGIGYAADVLLGKYKAEKSFVLVMLHTTFFPVALLGPVTDYSTMRKQYCREHIFDMDNMCQGIYRIAFGAFKKLVIADRLLYFTRTVADGGYEGIIVFFMLLVYSTALFCDFSGGTDIAIGICNILGIEVPENFKSPYMAENLAKFWQKWHITMGTWFKQYVFYPIAMNKRLNAFLIIRCNITDKKKRDKLLIYFALMVTWLLTGIWHGAGGRYIVWGLLNGIILVAVRQLSVKKKHSKPVRVRNIILTYCLVSILRVFDCYKTVKQCFLSLASILTLSLSGFAVFEMLELCEIIIAVLSVLFMLVMSCQKPTKYTSRIVAALLMILLCLVFGRYGLGYDRIAFIYQM